MTELVRLLLGLVILIGLLAALLVIAAAAIQLYRVIRWERSLQYTRRRPRSRERVAAFTVADPYAAAGNYLKAQLHVHTREGSRDAKLPLAEVIARYRERGYDLIFVTDHDRPAASTIDAGGLLILPGSEDTHPTGIAGHHLLRLNTTERQRGDFTRRLNSSYQKGGIAAFAHPSWRGGMGLGRWLPSDLPPLETPTLIEIFSRFSNSTAENMELWHYLLNRQDRSAPVWGIAVDDLHLAAHLDQGWVMIKSQEKKAASIIQALARGCFYASTGPAAEFSVAGGKIRAVAAEECRIRFIDAANRVVQAGLAREAEYLPLGDEGFVRVEIEALAGGIAWSQPFFLLPSA